MLPPFDPQELLASVDGDREFLAETVDMLAADAPDLLAQARGAIHSSDAPRLAAAAHTLKGMIANFRAEPARAVAQELELHGREETLDAAHATCDRLQTEVERLLDALRQFVAG